MKKLGLTKQGKISLFTANWFCKELFCASLAFALAINASAKNKVEELPHYEINALELQQRITGTVSDDNGTPLPGVTIVVQGTTNGTTTDFDGNYAINANQGDILEFSYIGLEQRNITVGSATVINVTMTESTSALDEVVVIGYGTKRKKDLTGSVSAIDADELLNEVKATPELALQGKLPGIFVSNPGSDPTARPTVRIRGVSTLGYNDPLYVIDGVPITEGFSQFQTGDGSFQGDLRSPINIFTLINPNDIESVSVLKDASATAIYGVRASNGVILIETKRGRKGNTRVNFSSSIGFQSIRGKYNTLTTQEYVDVYNEAWENNTSVSRDDNGRDGPLYDPSSPRYLGNSPTYTGDWVDNAIRQGAPVAEYNVSVSGGSDTSNFSVSAGYLDQSNVLYKEDYDRYNFSVNSDHQVTPWLKLGESYRLTYQQINEIGGVGITNAFLTPPWQPVFTSNAVSGYGGYGGFAYASPMNDDGTTWSGFGYGNSTRTNAFAFEQFEDVTHRNLVRNLGSVYAEVRPLKNFRVKGTLSIDYYTNERETFSGANPETSGFQNNGGAFTAGRNGSFTSFRDNRNLNIVKELLVGYNNTWGKHNVDLVFNVMDQDYEWYVRSNSAAIDALTFEQRFVLEGDPINYGFGDRFKDWNLVRFRAGLQGYMGRISYNYDGKYLIDATVRRDGSSKFAPGYKWGTFPAVGAAWRVSAEKFMENATWIDDMKFRFSWGQTGNQETRDFNYLSLVNSNPKTAFGANPNQIGTGFFAEAAVLGDFPVYDTSWETVTSTNFALDATLFNNSLTLTAEYYFRETEDILQAIDIPQVIGALGSPVVNLATVENKGFEFSADFNQRFGDFAFKASANLTTVKNEVTSLYQDRPQGGNQARIEVGYPIGYIYGYKTDGILQTQGEVDEYLARVEDPGNTAQLSPGDFRFQDIYGEPTESDGEFAYRSEGADGVINNLDQDYLGKTIPGYYYGFALGGEYKGFDVNLTFRGVGDVQRVNSVYWDGTNLGVPGINFLTDVRDRWTPDNPSNTIPRAVANDPSSNTRFSDRYVEDADFLRLQNLQFGYSFGQNVLEPIGATNLRLYASFSNVFVLTPWTGMDPENDTTPSVITMGFNIGF